MRPSDEDPPISDDRSNDKSAPHRSASERDDTQKASYIFQHFKFSRFTGEQSQPIELMLREYNFCARQHRLSPSQKADYFFIALDGPARTFIFNNARDDMSFQEMTKLMDTE